MSTSLQPHELQHSRPPCPSPTPRVYPNSCPLSQWCHSTISSCRPLLLLPLIFASIRVFSNESALRIRTKVLEFQLQHHPSNEHSGLISFRMDWLDLLAAQGALKSLLRPQFKSYTTYKKAETSLCQQRLSSQSYGFSRSHVWMWELDHKESWVPKNWCFWPVVLEIWFK